MLTGLYTHKHGLLRNERGFAASCEPPFGELKNAGYRLGYFGKGHAGFDNLQDYGFEGFFPVGYGNPYRTPAYRDYLNRHHLPDPLFRHEWGMNEQYNVGECYNLTQTDYFNRYGCGVFATPGPYHETDFLLDLSLDWLHSRAKEDAPFLLRVDVWGPHHAYQIDHDFADTLLDEKDIVPLPGCDQMPGADKPPFVQRYLDSMRRRGAPDGSDWAAWQPILKRAYENYSYIDMRLGTLLDELTRLGLRESTYVLLTADHGDAIATHGGMFDKCGDLAEELMDIPMVISGPGLPKGLALDGLTSNLDVLPTIFDFAGVKQPYPMDGVSLKRYALGGEARPSLMCEHYGHFENRFVQRCIYEGAWKYMATEANMDQLYLLDADPYELNNLAQDAQYAPRLARMKALLAEHARRFNDSPQVPRLGAL